jgi:hypothetical protein
VSRSATSILRNADRVEVFRVAPIRPRTSTGDTIGGYPTLAVGKEQGSEFAARLSTALRRWGVTWTSEKCGLLPSVAYRVWAGDQALEVLVCFKCDDFWPRVVGKVDPLENKLLAFDSVRPELLALTKEAFPDDPTIQAIPDVHTEESRAAAAAVIEAAGPPSIRSRRGPRRPAATTSPPALSAAPRSPPSPLPHLAPRSRHRCRRPRSLARPRRSAHLL